MQHTVTHDGFTEPTTMTLRADQDDPSRTARLPDEVQANSHVEGPQTSAQTAILHASSVERHGTAPAWLTEAMLAETRAETED